MLEGRVNHRDSVLEEAERAADDFKMICFSRLPGPPLVLALSVSPHLYLPQLEQKP
ncbi:unannotated protein [freshwater metagenome]|uniref:Unannotated protein n=1 Tax=freshwater metagenome TaxID=449393 RepID=A0A6J7JIF3_9ZZZZ